LEKIYKFDNVSLYLESSLGVLPLYAYYLSIAKMPKFRSGLILNRLELGSDWRQIILLMGN